MFQTPCGHNFCLKCFQKWIGQGKRTCAKCRRKFPPEMVNQPRINSTLVAAIRMAKVSRTIATGVPPSVYHYICNQDRLDNPFTTDRAKKNGMANASSGRTFVTVPKDHFGSIPAENDPERNQGVLVGESWKFRVECCQWGIHRPPVAGIAGQSKYGAQSVVLSGGYEDDEDHGEWFLYTGSSVHMSIGRSPFSVVYTKTPRHVVDLLHLPKVDGMHKSASNMAEQVKNVQEEVKAKLIASNAKYKAAADKKHRQQVFQVGEHVLIYLRKERYPAGTFHKLSPKKYGPFEIVRKINDNAYVVGIPDEWKTSKTFNVADIFKFYPGQELYPDKATSGTSFPQAGEYDGVHTSNTIQGT
nr:E3 ubiquitin-protein ligase ORTHRUS 2-like isoform X2 [Ipomoea batatas]